MTGLLSRYIARHVLGAVSLVLLIIVAINLLALVVDETQDIEGGYGFLEMLWYATCRVPGFVVENVPFACLVGSIAGLGVLAGNNELTIFRSGGVSVIAIVAMVVQPVLLVIVFGFGISQVSPGVDRYAEIYREALMDKDAYYRNQNRKAVWSKEGSSFVRFNNVQPDGRVYGLTRYEFGQQKQLVSAQYAREASYIDDGWLLESVETTRFQLTRTEVLKEESTFWKTPMSPDILVLITNDPENLTLQELWRYIAYLGEEGLDDRKHWLVLWQRVLQPLVIFGLVMVAISFVFGPLREATMGSRIFAGVVFGVVFKMASDVLAESSIVFRFDPLLAVMLPVVICVLLGAVLLVRVR